MQQTTSAPSRCSTSCRQRTVHQTNTSHCHSCGHRHIGTGIDRHRHRLRALLVLLLFSGKRAQSQVETAEHQRWEAIRHAHEDTYTSVSEWKRENCGKKEKRRQDSERKRRKEPERVGNANNRQHSRTCTRYAWSRLGRSASEKPRTVQTESLKTKDRQVRG